VAWIKTIEFGDADEKLQKMLMGLRASCPVEYAESTAAQTGTDESIISSHTLIPPVMFHIFAAFGEMMSPELPLGRRQHEMIATMVSATNSCHY
jgi:hypothetical protein